MKLRIGVALITVLALVGAAACETNDDAERDDDRPSTRQRQEPDRDKRGQMEKRHDRQQRRDRACPMALEGTQVDVQKQDDAVAVEFTTSGDVDRLREHVRQMAQMHDQQRGMHRGRMPHGRGMMTDAGDAGRPMRRGRMMDAGDAGPMRRRRGMMDAGDAGRPMRRRMMMMRQTDVRTEEIEDGMRMLLAPQDPDQLDMLHQHIQQRMQRMEQMGDCPMRRMMGMSPPSDDE